MFSEPYRNPTPRELRTQLENELNEQVHRILSEQFPTLLISTKPVQKSSTLSSAFGQNQINKQFKKSKHEKNISINMLDEGMQKCIDDSKTHKIKKAVSFSNDENSFGREYIINSFPLPNDFDKKDLKMHSPEVKFKTRQYYSEMMQLANNDFGSMSKIQKKSYYYIHTVQGFTESLTLGKLPDGTNLQEVEPGKFTDYFGFVRWLNGPFWPSDYGPLHPAPILKRNNSVNFPEPLLNGGSNEFNVFSYFKIRN